MKRFFIFFLLMFLAAGCTPPPQSTPSNVDTTNLTQLKYLTYYTGSQEPNAQLGHIRLQALQETATSLGAQAALAKRSGEIDDVLNQQASQLDQTYNFRVLLLPDNVLPPVLEESNQILTLDDPDTIRLADKTYKIVSQARFVTAPPNWRQYLILSYQKPAVPDRTLLPRNQTEREVWIQALEKGWDQGLQQAQIIYSANLARLDRDYKGMLLYSELLNEHLVSKPEVAATDLGVTSRDNNSQLYINDKVLRITALPELNPNSNEWKAVLTHGQ